MPIDKHSVLLLVLVAGMGEQIRQLTVVGEQYFVTHQVHLEAKRPAVGQGHLVAEEAVGLDPQADVPPLGMERTVGAGNGGDHPAV